MTSLPSARSSPRIINGVLKWYEGDTFTLDLELQLEDQDGTAIDIASADTVDIVFSNRSDDIIKDFEFTNIKNNTVTIVVDAEVSALFTAGEYKYNVIYKGSNRTTIAHDNDVIVE